MGGAAWPDDAGHMRSEGFHHPLLPRGKGKARAGVEREHPNERPAIDQRRAHTHMVSRWNTERGEIERRIGVHDALTVCRDPAAQSHADAHREPPHRGRQPSRRMCDDEHVVIAGDVERAGGPRHVALQQRRRKRNQVSRWSAIGCEAAETRQRDFVGFLTAGRRGDG